MMPHKSLPIVDWSEIEASAPAKFIISGEYAVVYDRQAIATTIDLRTKVKIRPNKENKIRLNLKDFKDVREWPITSLRSCRLVSKYLEYLMFEPNMTSQLNSLLEKKYQIQDTSHLSEDQLKQANDATMAFLLLYVSMGDSYASSARMPIEVDVESDIPIGSGLGSSSALSVALSGALLRVFRVSTEKYVVSKWAFNIDKFFHGQPSGVDNNIISNGGFISFKSGVSRSTKELCKKVQEKIKNQPAVTEQIFTDINIITTRIWREIIRPEFIPSSIYSDLQANQELLQKLGVDHEKIIDICRRAEKFNLVAKLTGAGGGGTVFVLFNQDDLVAINQLKTELIDAGYTIREHSIGCEGLIVQKNQVLDNK